MIQGLDQYVLAVYNPRIVVSTPDVKGDLLRVSA